MQVEKWDGTKEVKRFDSVPEMMEEAAKVAKDPGVKKITLLFPKKRKNKK